MPRTRPGQQLSSIRVPLGAVWTRERTFHREVAISRAGAIPPLVRLLDDDEQRARL